MNTYLRSLDFVVYDYRINFNSIEFRNSLRLIGTTSKLIFMKVYYSINKIKRYYRSFYRIYKIVYEEYLNFYNDYKL